MESRAKKPTGLVSRRSVLAGAVGAAALAGTRGAIAQNYPSKLITLVVPYAAGGSTDVIARVIAEKLRTLLGTSVIVENKPGAGGVIGAAAVARSQPNGSTLLMAPSGAMALVPLTQKEPPFDAVKDFTPVAAMHKYELFLYSRTKGGYRSLEELAAAHKAGKSITMALSGHGNSTHYCSFLLGQEMGINFIHVPYNGGAPSILSILKGEVDVGFLPGADAQAQVDSGDVRAFLVTSKTRSKAFPDVPTISDAGLKEPELDVWMGLFGPSGLPEEIVGTVSRAVSAIYDSGVLDKHLGTSTRMSGSPTELAASLASDIVKYRRFIEAAGFLRDQK